MKKKELRKENERLRDLLSNVVWVQPTHNGSPSCSYCGNQKHWDHSENCPMKEFDLADE